MQFLSENRVSGCQIFGRFGFSKTESELNFGFTHIPRLYEFLLRDSCSAYKILNADW